MATEIETKTAGLENGVKASKTADRDDLSPVQDADADAPSKKKKKRKATADTLPELEVDLSLPEPPSKRARRALKKGKPLPAKPKSDDEDDDEDDDGTTAAGKKDKKDKDGKPTKEPRSQFGIWIGNLPFTVTRTQLFRWFVDSSGGAITEDAITRVNLPLAKKEKKSGVAPRSRPGKPADAEQSDDATSAAITTPSQNRGFAYVDFSTYAAQIAAIALSESELDGRRVLIKDSKSYAGRPTPGAAAAGAASEGTAAAAAAAATAAAATAPPGATSTKIFVGNLGFDTTEEDLRRHFAPCGPVAWAKVATFPDNTEKCRGYGWVQFGGGGGSAAGAAGAGGADSEDGEDEGRARKPAAGTKQSPETAAAIASEAAAAAVRGFVRIQETIDTEEDFVAEAAAVAEGEEEKEEKTAADDDDDVDDDEDNTAGTAAAAAKRAQPRTRTRKWWVNMLKGRPLKVQFAEDDRVRYKKRFGKDRPQDRVQQNIRQASTTQHGEPRRQQRDRSGGETAAPQEKAYKYQDLSIARRTGAITESLGKKTLLE